jgi:hypothetical protein
MPLVRLSWVLLAFTVVTQPLAAQQSLSTNVPGDPLPPGAFARLGAQRFRVTGPVFGARFLDGGKKLLVGGRKGPGSIRGDESIFRLF